MDLSNLQTSEITPTIQNIVATVNLGCKLDLKQISSQARNAEYNPGRFSALIMRIKEPKTTALFFDSGKMVCAGAKTEDDSKIAARKYARILQKMGFPIEFKDFKIRNVVASCDLKFLVKLEMLACSCHAKFIVYEPEIFPGLFYRMQHSNIAVLVFFSGKIIITGAKNKEEIYVAYDSIYPVLKEFKK